MTPDQFRAALAETGISRPWLAAAAGRSRTWVDQLCDGRVSVPAELADWLTRRAADPPPRLADRRRAA
jgi:hypothetical protein